jgi:hypothetical protein
MSKGKRLSEELFSLKNDKHAKECELSDVIHCSYNILVYALFRWDFNYYVCGTFYIIHNHIGSFQTGFTNQTARAKT